MAHTHHCKVCNEAVGICDDAHCQGENYTNPDTDLVTEGHYCSRHHPDPAHRIEDKPTVRMTVSIAKDPEPVQEK